jgi:molecular chaperone DnaJ
MAAADRDYYALLGVPRDASEAAIKKAFRTLAREHHPDVSDAPDADERFKEIVEAYEVLSNHERRSLYDRFGHDGLRRGGFVPTAFDFGDISDLFAAFFGDDLFGARGRRSRRGADVGAEVEIELGEAATGVDVPIALDVAVTCETCGGNGAEPGTGFVTCSTCEGNGSVRQVSRTVFGEFVRTQACPTCGGAGRVVETPCGTCAGAGQTIEQRTVEVSIPPGIHDGQRIRLTGEGHAGEPGGAAGDVYVLVHVQDDPRFVREGNDIYSSIDVPMTAAALGTTITIPTLDGEEEIEVAAGTQPGHVHVLRGRGMPVLQGRGRGDHRVLVNVLVPRRLTKEQRDLLAGYAAKEDDAAYEDDEGFVDRLRARFR